MTDDMPDLGALIDQVNAETRDLIAPAMAAMRHELITSGVPATSAAVMTGQYWGVYVATIKSDAT